MRNRIATIFATVLVSAIVPSPSANASLIFQIGSVFNGSTATSTPPWLTATFANAGTNTVTLTLGSSLGVSSEFIDEVTFNVDSSIVPSSLTIVESPPTGSALATIISTIDNAQALSGSGAMGTGFDVAIAFENAPPGNRFDDSNVAIFTMTATGLTENAFNFTNSGGAGAYVGVHIQGIPLASGGTVSGAGGDTDGPAGTLPIPEPATLGLLGLGLAAMGFSQRRTSN